MSMRRDNRQAAIQFLYSWSINPPEHLSEELKRFFTEQEHPRDYYAFAESLIQGVVEHVEAIDEVIKNYAKNWDYHRIARIDLSILRLAIYEMKYRDDIPPVVSINEAIDLSKAFSIPESKRFINGILDQFKMTLNRPLRESNERS